MEVIGILIMKQDLLAKHIKEGLSYFKEVSELPEWLLPGVPEVAAQLGDKKILDLTADHKIKEEAEQLIKQTETAIIPAESWRQGIAQWPAVDQVRPVVLALLRARDKIDALLRQGNKEANSFSIVCAPWPMLRLSPMVLKYWTVWQISSAVAPENRQFY